MGQPPVWGGEGRVTPEWVGYYRVRALIRKKVHEIFLVCPVALRFRTRWIPTTATPLAVILLRGYTCPFLFSFFD